MAVLSGNGDFLTFQRQTLDKSPQDVRSYWTPERKQKAIPTFRAGTVADAPDMPPDGANAAPTTDPKQADLSKMPFITAQAASCSSRSTAWTTSQAATSS